MNQAQEVELATAPKPWRRFWARNIDVLLFTLIVMLIGVFIDWDSFNRFSSASFNILVLFLYIFVEWGYGVLFGATPGKKLLGIVVETSDGQKMTSYTALKRARLIWLRGMGAGIAIIQIITFIVAYIKLKRNLTTSWDEDLDLVVRYKKINPFRLIAGLAFVILIYLIGFILLVVEALA